MEEQAARQVMNPHPAAFSRATITCVPNSTRLSIIPALLTVLLFGIRAELRFVGELTLKAGKFDTEATVA